MAHAHLGGKSKHPSGEAAADARGGARNGGEDWTAHAGVEIRDFPRVMRHHGVGRFPRMRVFFR